MSRSGVDSIAVRSGRPAVSAVSILVPIPRRCWSLRTCTSATSTQSASQPAVSAGPIVRDSAAQTASYHH